MSQTRSRETEAETFVETSLKLSGKSEEEARSTGAIDRADEHVESFFESRYQTTASPIHRAVWDHDFPLELFQPTRAGEGDAGLSEDDGRVAVDRARRHIAAGTLLDEHSKLLPHVFAELGAAGYWGMLVEQRVRRACDSHVGLHALSHADGHGLSHAGRFGERARLRRRGRSFARHGDARPETALSHAASQWRTDLGFCFDRAGLGSDMTALRTRAVLDGDDYVVNGEKLFITNAIPGRMVALVCLIDNRPEVLLVDLPEENEHFQLVRYGLYCAQAFVQQRAEVQ